MYNPSLGEKREDLLPREKRGSHTKKTNADSEKKLSSSYRKILSPGKGENSYLLERQKKAKTSTSPY